MAYTTIDNPELYFQTKLYTGTGSALSITLDGSENMQPDWVWIKERNASASFHNLTDSVRGAGKGLFSNSSNAEYDYGTGASGSLRSFDSDGFTLGTASQVNPSGTNMVSWNWKAGGSASSNSNGSITSSVSANTTAGFSIVSYTGTGSAATVGHGLGAAPKMFIVKNRSSAESWRIYHNALGATKEIYLDLTSAAGTSSSSFNDTEPTSSVFSVGTGNGTNKSSENLIAYCFAEKKGYSSFGSYIGNGNADGPFVFCGFRPAWVLQKNTGATQGWQLQDNKRLGYNPDNYLLQPHTNQAESALQRVDLLSNGFKVRTTDAGQNSSGTTYIYMAFAESPFVNSNGVPNNAR